MHDDKWPHQCLHTGLEHLKQKPQKSQKPQKAKKILPIRPKNATKTSKSPQHMADDSKCTLIVALHNSFWIYATFKFQSHQISVLP